MTPPMPDSPTSVEIPAFHATGKQMAKYGTSAYASGVPLGVAIGLLAVALLLPVEWMKWTTIFIAAAFTVAGWFVAQIGFEARETMRAHALAAALDRAIRSQSNG